LDKQQVLQLNVHPNCKRFHGEAAIDPQTLDGSSEGRSEGLILQRYRSCARTPVILHPF
jgi:hypothetical protein